MKALTLLSLFLIIADLSSAQVTDSTQVTIQDTTQIADSSLVITQDSAPIYQPQLDKQYVYCMLTGFGIILRGFSPPYATTRDIAIKIELGDKTQKFKDKRLREETDEGLKFDNMMDALNYMVNQGWELVQPFALYAGQTNAVFFYLLKMEKQKYEAEIIE